MDERLFQRSAIHYSLFPPQHVKCSAERMAVRRTAPSFFSVSYFYFPVTFPLDLRTFNARSDECSTFIPFTSATRLKCDSLHYSFRVIRPWPTISPRIRLFARGSLATVSSTLP